MHFGCAKYISSNDLKVIFKTKWGGNNEVRDGTKEPTRGSLRLRLVTAKRVHCLTPSLQSFSHSAAI